MTTLLGRLAITFGAALMAVTFTACSSSSGASSPPDVTGTWSGEYTYPVQDGTSLVSTETITITKQDGAMLWATTEWTASGDTGRGQAVGTIVDGNRVYIAENDGGAFQGTVDDNTMTLTFIRTDALNTAFQVVLTRQ
ncbi:MAG: hypothetical protein Q7V58_16000 [Actinomycetota bacterium]|nr:hypothetical protein [Actinomycetota bacterium]